MQPPHISNFLRNKRRLSLPALDRVLAALELSVADLVTLPPTPAQQLIEYIPLVSQDAAMRDERIRPSAITERLPLPGSLLAHLRAEHGARRPTRDRFVAVGLTPAQARPMDPLLQPNSIVILDRHSTLPTPSIAIPRNIYAVRLAGQLSFCYLSFDRNFFILRPHSFDFEVQLLPVPPNITPSDLVTGRVCAVITSF